MNELDRINTRVPVTNLAQISLPTMVATLVLCFCGDNLTG